MGSLRPCTPLDDALPLLSLKEVGDQLLVAGDSELHVLAPLTEPLTAPNWQAALLKKGRLVILVAEDLLAPGTVEPGTETLAFSIWISRV